MKLTVQSKLGTKLGIGQPVGVLRPQESKTVDVSANELERIAPQLTRLQAAGYITFEAYNDPNATNPELDTQFMTAEDVYAAVSVAMPVSLAGTDPIVVSAGPNYTVSITPASQTDAGSFSASDKTRLDALIDPCASTVYVFSEADLPTPVGGVITLVSGLIYQLMASIVLTPGNRIVTPSDVNIVGVAPNVTRIEGNIDAALLTVTTPGPNGGGRMRFIEVKNTNTGASARAMAVTSASAVMRVSDTLLYGPSGALYVTGTSGLQFFNSSLTATLAGVDVVRIDGSGPISFDYCQSVHTGVTGNHINITAGATVASMLVLRHAFVFFTAAQYGIRFDATATITNRVSLESIIRAVAAGTINLGWTQGTPKWTTLSVESMPDSAVMGGAYATGPFTVAFSASDTFTLVAPTVGTPWVVDDDTERFSLVSTANGRLKYTGTTKRRVSIAAGVTVSKSGTTTASSVAVFINNVIHASSESISDVTTRTTTIVAMPSLHVLSPNDEIDLRISNNDTTDSYTITRASLTITAGNIS